MLQTLTTPRGKTLSGTPWQVYPRPQMRRDSYINLNGEWDFAVSSGKPETFDMRITVPFCPESRLSGIGGILKKARHYGIADAFFCPRASAGSGCCSTSALPIKLQRCS